MDESGNKESDRFFVVGFLEVSNILDIYATLDRIKDQVFHNAVYKRLQRINKLYAEANIDNYSILQKIIPDLNLNLVKLILITLYFFKI